ncbi:Syntaxin-6 [Balamuthia mandrillaris]
MQDPFYVVKEEVQQSVNGAKTLFARWEELLEHSNTAQDEEFKFTGTELKTVIRSIEWDLQDLEETIRIVQNNRAKFQIEEAEVATRQAFVQEVKNTIANMKTKMNSAQTQAKMERDKRKVVEHSTKPSRGKERNQRSMLEDAIHQENENFFQQQRLQQMRLREEEDMELDELHAGVEKLEEIGITINDELTAQESLIKRLGDEVDNTNSKILFGIKKLSTLIDQSSGSSALCPVLSFLSSPRLSVSSNNLLLLLLNTDRTSWLIIFVLMVLLVLLLIAVIYL